MRIARVAERYGLGRPLTAPTPVRGGLSNEMWRLNTDRGTYAVKRMLLNADRPDFETNVEAAYRIEARAWAAGVPMAEPMPAGGRALARVDGALVRVHRWIDGVTGAGTARQAAGLLAAIHAAGRTRATAAAPVAWRGDAYGADIAALARRVAGGPGRTPIVDSHGDLDRKNALLRPDGVLAALDWDAAGPAAAVHEAVAVALDWSAFDPGEFGAGLDEYARAGGIAIPPGDWRYAGWVAAQGGWLDHHAGRPGGAGAVTATLDRLRRFAAFLGPGTPDHP